MLVNSYLINRIGYRRRMKSRHGQSENKRWKKTECLENKIKKRKKSKKERSWRKIRKKVY